MIAGLLHLFRGPARRAQQGFRTAQIFSALFIAYSHGANDAQKTMGIITLALVASTGNPGLPRLPLWVVLTAATAIGLGTYAGGWRIMRTIGNRVAQLEPPHGFAAQTMASDPVRPRRTSASR